MIGSVIVAVITVSLLFAGVYIGNVQNADDVATDKVESYDENFFGSIDSLVGGLGQSAERGEETREDRYQQYLETKERSVEANTNLQSSSPAPSTYFARPSTTDTASQANSTVQAESQSTSQSNADKKTSSGDSATTKTTTSTTTTSTTSIGTTTQQGAQNNADKKTSSGDSVTTKSTTTSTTTTSATPAPSVPTVDDFGVEDLDDLFSDFDDDLGIDF